ncbi:MAG TPA: LytTR family DNA-binding domain-containing protein [Candidatus Acidoferrum sp.]|nr:LytTR family DNA-binding domain-containing protein [Candidatus Acidoferrum sp.]
MGNSGQGIIDQLSHEELELTGSKGRYTVVVFQVRDSGSSDGNAETHRLARADSRLAVVTDADEDSQRVAAECVRRLFSNECELKTVSVTSTPGDIFGTEAGDGRGEKGKDSVRAARIAVRTDGKIIFVNPADVRVIEAQGNYVLLQTASKSHSLRESISNVAEKLEAYGFVRIHRSTIVNSSLVEEIRTSPSGDIRVCLKGSTKEYSVSRRYRNALRSIAPCWI